MLRDKLTEELYFIERLNILYRKFQDAYVEDSGHGKVGVMSINRKLCDCGDDLAEHRLKVDELPLSWMKTHLVDLQNLLPENVILDIWCLPETADILEISW